ncbi:MAG: ATP-binding cassette domain-containing protein [Betaproteobacteria bacterium]|nr:ATP-binding cassette domain-containing protein [Betaproteobacteria bacterium]
MSADSLPAVAPRARGDIKKLAALTRFILPYKGRFLLAMFALAVAASMVLAIGQGLKHVIDQGFTAANGATLDQTLGWLMVMLVALGASTFTRYYLITWVGERFVADLRRALFDHVLKLSPAFFETTRTGEVISRITNDTTLLDSVVGGAFSWALRNVVLLIGGMTMLFITSVKLTIFVLAGIPFVIAPILLLGRRVRKLARTMTDRVADATAFIDETLHEVRTVQAYGHEAVDRGQFAARIEAVFGAATLKARFNAGLIATVIVLAFGAIGVILWVGGHDVIEGRLSAGELSAFVFYAVIVANAVNAVSEVYGELMRAAGASERLMEILNTRPAIEAPVQPLPFPTTAGGGDIEIDNLTFFYPSRPERAALSDFSLHVTAGERVALVGPSGAGKTTVFQLLSRFYDPANGHIRIDGVELRAADPLAVRNRIAVVSQDPVIFAASVLDNVRYGRPEAGEDEVRGACEAAFAREFIEQLPQGYHTYLGERGVRLSGGQRQRIAIARAFLADRSILLLDEATSALDAESERMVQLAMEKLMQGRTTLIIAHRLATVKSADRIVVMDEGRIVASGTHESLVAAGGLYARLAALQFNTG